MKTLIAPAAAHASGLHEVNTHLRCGHVFELSAGADADVPVCWLTLQGQRSPDLRSAGGAAAAQNGFHSADACESCLDLSQLFVTSLLEETSRQVRGSAFFALSAELLGLLRVMPRLLRVSLAAQEKQCGGLVKILSLQELPRLARETPQLK